MCSRLRPAIIRAWRSYAVQQAAPGWSCLTANAISTRLYSTPPLPPALLPDIGFDELRGKLKKKEDLTLIDVRTPEELTEFGEVPGSVSLPLKNLGLVILLPEEDFEKETGWEKPNADAPIVVMCKLGIRARTGQLALQAAGYSNVRMYPGSFTEWEEKGGEIIKPSGGEAH